MITTGRQVRVRVPPTTDRQKLKEVAAGLFNDGGSTVLMDGLLEIDERFFRRSENRWPVFVIFTSDGIVMQSDRPAARGRAAIAQVYSGQGGNDLRLRAFSYAVSDSVGFILGGYRYGAQPNDVGKFTLTLRRVEGRWLITSDMDNANVAAPKRGG